MGNQNLIYHNFFQFLFLEYQDALFFSQNRSNAQEKHVYAHR